MPDIENCGVYAITSLSGKFYIGSSCDIRNRWRRHRLEMRTGIHPNRRLIDAYRKYGDTFEFKVLLICSKEHLLLYEQIAIDGLKPHYNLSPTAGSIAGITHLPEVYATRVAAAKLRRASPETRALIGAASRNRKASQENRDKRSATLIATMSKPDVKAKMISAAQRRAADKSICEKISKSLKGRKKPPFTKEHIDKIAAKKRNTRWITNGIESSLSHNPPPPEWWYGRLKRNKSVLNKQPFIFDER